MGRTGKAPNATTRKGKGKEEASLGKALQRRQIQQLEEKRANARFDVDGSVARGKYVSVLDANSLEDFIASAMLSGREFESHKAHTVVLDSATGQELHLDGSSNPTDPNSGAPSAAHIFEFEQMSVPRRPAWTPSMTAEELDKQERQAFIEWRRGIAGLEETRTGSKVTPFEKNLEVWRQLWRVMERSDVIVQIVDARNPLFYYSRDLLAYARELSPPKPVVILVNKSDYLTAAQRRAWAAHFLREGWEGLFFSARASQVKLNREARLARGLAVEDADHAADSDDDDISDDDSSDGDDSGTDTPAAAAAAGGAAAGAAQAHDGEQSLPPPPPQAPTDSAAPPAPLAVAALAAAVSAEGPEFEREVAKRARLLSREELLHVLEVMARSAAEAAGAERRGGAIGGGDGSGAAATVRPCAGMVGYPNVGKSSVINVLAGATPFSHGTARVSVGATPGKTKHFQTIVLSDALMLCDCPGLVFPSFVASAAEMVCAGVLPIMQMRDAIAPMSLVARRVPRHILELTYTIAIREGAEEAAAAAAAGGGGGGSTRQPTATELLTAVCESRGLYRAGGLGDVDLPRAARMLLKDYTDGTLLFCHAPPSLDTPTTAAFLRETERTHLSSARLAAKLAAQQRKVAGSAAAAAAAGGEVVDGAELTARLRARAEAIRAREAAEIDGPTKAEQGFARWGKKNKKLRDKTPYAEWEGGGAAGGGGLGGDSGAPPPTGASVSRGGKKPNKKQMKRAAAVAAGGAQQQQAGFVRVALPHHPSYAGPVGHAPA